MGRIVFSRTWLFDLSDVSWLAADIPTKWASPTYERQRMQQKYKSRKNVLLPRLMSIHSLVAFTVPLLSLAHVISVISLYGYLNNISVFNVFCLLVVCIEMV